MPAKKKVAAPRESEATASESAENQKQRPTEFQVGRAVATMWRNPSTQEPGKTWQNLTMKSIYATGEGESQTWHESDSFGAHDLGNLIAALETAQHNGLGWVGEEQLKSMKAVVVRSNGAIGTKTGRPIPDVVSCGNAEVRIWQNQNEAGQQWKSATVSCRYQKGGQTLDGKSFARVETAQLIVALKRAQQLMGTPEGVSQATTDTVDDVVNEPETAANS